jgi:ABC-type transporter Mla subunit MlaD
MKKFDEVRLYAWIELAVWLIIIALCVFGIRYHHYKTQKQFKSYQIFMNDVDGLIVGSPVRFLGIQIGHVTKIQLVSSDVYSDIYVKFIITQKDLTLPTGSVATVEGSGLGGSKSLEIYPPKNEDNKDKIIASKDSTRLNKVMGLFNKIFKDLEEIFTNIGHTGKELSKVPKKEIEKNIVTPAQSEKELRDLNKQLDIYIQKEKDFRNKYLKDKPQNTD